MSQVKVICPSPENIPVYGTIPVYIVFEDGDKPLEFAQLSRIDSEDDKICAFMMQIDVDNGRMRHFMIRTDFKGFIHYLKEVEKTVLYTPQTEVKRFYILEVLDDFEHEFDSWSEFDNIIRNELKDEVINQLEELLGTGNSNDSNVIAVVPNISKLLQSL